MTPARSRCSLTLAGLVNRPDLPVSSPKELIALASARACSGIQLDAAAPGLRPRELDRSARRDLAATIRRDELTLTGLDLFIPAAHFTDPAHQDRAVAGVRGAVELAGELRATLGGPPHAAIVCLTMPVSVPGTLLSELAAHAERHGVTIADHAWPPRVHTLPSLRPGVDPASIILAGARPVESLLSLPAGPASARVNDLASTGRIAPGSGSFDVREYIAALAAIGFSGLPVIDLRGLENPLAALQRLQSLIDSAPLP